MRAWLVLPSARPAPEVARIIDAWRAQGYRTAILRDQVDVDAALYPDLTYFSVPVFGGYPGYAMAVNYLVKQIIESYSDAEWFIAAGDDTLPDPTKRADDIAAECKAHFAELHSQGSRLCTDTFGVMQPIGDKWGDQRGPYIERIAGSAWIGRDFCRLMNKGQGPLYPGFKHMFVDEALRDVAVRLGVYWERPDLTHYHEHWGRRKPGRPMPSVDRMPDHLRQWNTAEHWDWSKQLLNRLRATNYEECMPCE